MKKIIIIDGYNAIQRSKEFAAAMDESLEAGRSSFLGRIKNYSANKRTFDEIIVVFDAARNSGDDCQPRKYKDGTMTVVFSSYGESADDLIKSIVRNNKTSCKITIVSDDNYVINSGKSHAADIMSSKKFTDLISAAAKKRHFDADEKQLDFEDVTDINEQLKKQWRIK